MQFSLEDVDAGDFAAGLPGITSAHAAAQANVETAKASGWVPTGERTAGGIAASAAAAANRATSQQQMLSKPTPTPFYKKPVFWIAGVGVLGAGIAAIVVIRRRRR